MRSFDGLGFFYASGDMLDAEKSAKRCADAGASWAAVLVESVDGRKQRPERVRAAVEALRAVDVRPEVYTFPGPGKGVEAAQRAVAAAKANKVGRVIVDVEPHDGGDWTSNDLREIADVITGAGLEVAWTTFPRGRWRVTRWPAGPMLLQAYKTIRDREDTLAAIRVFATGGREIVLCIGTHLDDGLLPHDLAALEQHGASAAGVWCLLTTSEAEAKALREWAVRPR